MGLNLAISNENQQASIRNWAGVYYRYETFMRTQHVLRSPFNHTMRENSIGGKLLNPVFSWRHIAGMIPVFYLVTSKVGAQICSRVSEFNCVC